MYHSNYVCQLRMLFTSASGMEQNINKSAPDDVEMFGRMVTFVNANKKKKICVKMKKGVGRPSSVVFTC